MFTYDEWGNYVYHIITGKKGLQILKEAGFTNSMTPEEYEKHMNSYRRIQKQRSDELWKSILSCIQEKE